MGVESTDDLHLNWCLRGEPLSDDTDRRNENRFIEFIPFEGEYKEYLQKLIKDNLSDD